MPVFVEGNQGLGDNFYQRPGLLAFARQHDLVYLATSWPWVYHDVPNVLPVYPKSLYRTQVVHMETLGDVWHTPPGDAPQLTLGYGIRDFSDNRTPAQSYARCFNVNPLPSPLRLKPQWLVEAERLLARMNLAPGGYSLVHPPSVRSEWPCSSRCPDTRYLQQVIDARDDCPWVSVGFFKGDEEKLFGEPLRGPKFAFHHGELSITMLAALVFLAKRVLTGVCYMLPMAQTLGVGKKMLVVFGGGVPPDLLLDPLLGELPVTVAPRQFCKCYGMDHPCHRTIHSADLEAALAQLP